MSVAMFNATVFVKEQMESQFIQSHVDFGMRLIFECANLYGFSADEAIRTLNLASVKLDKAANRPKGERVKKVKAAKPSFPIPFNGKANEGCCAGLKFNRGLYTQCASKAPEGSGFCKGCQTQADKNGNGKPDCGTIADRLCVGLYEFRDPKGKAPIAFTSLLNKLKLSEDAVKEEAGKLGVMIDPEHFDYIEIKPSKAKKTKKDSESSEKKGKGRPKKTKKVLEIEGDTNDLFASLVAQANSSESVGDESDSEDLIIEKVTKPKKSDDEKEAKRKAKEEEKAKKELAKLEEKEAKRLAAEAEKEAKRLAAEAEKAKKEAEKEAKRLAAEAEKAKKEAEKKAKEEEKAKKEAEKKAKSEKVTEKKKDTPKSTPSSSPKKEKTKEDNEPDVVKRFEFEGKKYLKSKKTGIVYNMDQDEIGKWNEETQKIDFFENDSDEEQEEDYDDEE